MALGPAQKSENQLRQALLETSVRYIQSAYLTKTNPLIIP